MENGSARQVSHRIDLLGPDTPAGARLAEHATFFDFVSGEMPEVLKRWAEYRAGSEERRP